MLVFLFHVYGINFGAVQETPSLPMSYIVAGNTGVTLFFVLSGFLLSLPWLMHLLDKESEMPGLKSFYLARALRVLPLYLIVVAFSAVVSGKYLVGGKAALFMFVGFDIFPYSVVWWTLATEIQFYLALPLAFWAWSHSRLTRLLLCSVLMAWAGLYVYLILLQNLPADELNYFYQKSLFGRLPAFLIGIVAAGIYLRFKQAGQSGQGQFGLRLLASVVFVAMVLGLGLVLRATAGIGDSHAEDTWHIHHTLEALCWAGMILCLVLANPLGKEMLVNRPLAIAGKLSYSLYLVHVPILFYLIYPVKNALGDAAYASSVQAIAWPIVALALSLGLSVVTYRLIELPFLNLKKRIPG
jgi:peptidoglycan/LPS O-acetylase OafA/YrhL